MHSFHDNFRELNGYLGQLQFIHAFQMPQGQMRSFSTPLYLHPPSKILRAETTSSYTVRGTCLQVWTSFNNLLQLARWWQLPIHEILRGWWLVGFGVGFLFIILPEDCWMQILDNSLTSYIHCPQHRHLQLIPSELFLSK